MKFKIIFSLLTILCLANCVFSQETKSKLRFDVLDESNGFFADLKASDIEIAGIKDISLDLAADRSLEIMIMIDASASQERMLPSEKTAAQTFINSFLKTGKDKVAVVSFSEEVALEQDLTGDFQRAADQIGKIRFIPPSGYVGRGVVVGQIPPNVKQKVAGSTSIWDSLIQVLEAFSKIENSGAQRAIILISDGVNTVGENKIREAIEFSIKTKIPVYAIGIGDDLYEGVDRNTLKKITEETGGVSIFPKKKPGDLPQLLKMIEQSLGSDYELAFTLNASSSKGKMQEMKIRIVNPELRKRKLQIVQPKGVFISN